MNRTGPQLDPRTILRRGDAALKRGDVQQAIALYERAGEMYEVLDHRLKAVGVWRAILRQTAGRLDIRIRLAEGLAALSLKAEAMAEFQRVAESAEANGDRELFDRAMLGIATL